MPDEAPVAIGVIAPHGDLAIAEACDDDTRPLAAKSQRAMARMAERVALAQPDTFVIATPHNVHVSGHMAVLTSSELTGQLEEAASPITLTAKVDRDLAVAVHEAMNEAGAPTVQVSYGGNDPAEAVSPMDWGVLVPLWHLASLMPETRVVVVAPARDLDAAAHVTAGGAIARAAREAGKRIAFIASADQGHGHQADGPYGFHRESAAFDERIQDIVRRNALHELLDITEEAARAALVDSWWQMLMLYGALKEDGGDFGAELLAYEAPTYYGMLTAVFAAGGPEGEPGTGAEAV
jgi:aromatic ring-opening dioxygenase LigB subunit